MNINQISDLYAHVNALQALGFSGENSLEQLVGAAQVAAPELAGYLGVTVADFAAIVNTSVSSAASIPASAVSRIEQATYSLGVTIERITQSALAPALPVAPQVACQQVNLVGQMSPIRNQAARGTCVAHAALAAYEHLLITQGAYQDLSEQFLYWNCKRSDGNPTQEGTWLAVAVPLLQRDGCCLESTWPYNPNPIAGNEGQGPPPPGAQLAALSFRLASFRQLAPTSIVDIKNELCNGNAVAFSIPVFNSWYASRWVAYTGDITMPVPNEIRVGGHAMCIVGFEDSNDVGLGGGRFIIRNSWGPDWGINAKWLIDAAGTRTPSPGYGTIPYAYLSRLGTEAFSVA